MSWYPQNATGLNYISYPVGPTPVGLALTSSGSINTKGSYAQLIASTPFTCNSVRVLIANTVATLGRFFLFDVATGAGGAEVVVAPNLPAEGSGTGSIYPSGLFTLPLAIASGTRIALRCQCSTATQAMNVSVTLVAAGGVAGVASFTNYGCDITTSLPISLDPGGTANTKGAYSEITPSTSAIAQWLLVLITQGHTSVAAVFWLVDIATGAGGAEVVLIPDLLVANAGTQAAVQPKSYELLTYLAASTRIAARCSATTNTVTTRLLSLGLLATAAPIEDTISVSVQAPSIFWPGGVARY